MTILMNKIPISSNPSERQFPERDTWLDGKLVLEKGDKYTTLYLYHESEKVLTSEMDEEGNEVQKEVEIVRAFPIIVANPFTKDKAINAAEMTAYGLKDALDVASFNASLARKARMNASDSEVIEHDNFINDIKIQIDKIINSSTEAQKLAIAKSEMIQRIKLYDLSDEVNSFYYNGEKTWFTNEARVSFRNSISSAETLGESFVKVPVNGVMETFSIQDAKEMLSKISRYADDAYLVTQNHIAWVNSMTNIDSVNNFKYKNDYPKKVEIINR